MFCCGVSLLCRDPYNSVWSACHYVVVPDGAQTLSKDGAKDGTQNSGTHRNRRRISVARPSEIKGKGKICGILIKSPAFLALLLISSLSCVRRSVCCCIFFASGSLAKNCNTACVRASVFGRALSIVHCSRRPWYGKPGGPICAVMSAKWKALAKYSHFSGGC